MYKTPYDVGTTEEFVSPSGDFTRTVYKPILEKDGHIELVEDGIEMTYEKIQSYKDSVDINVIVSRFAAGDAAALEQVSGVYGDFIQVPGSYMEALNAVVEARNAYELSGMDISFEEFINKALNPISKPSETIKEEVITDEQKSE